MADNLKILGVIPARYDSTRLPGKVLRNIAGKPMLYWVYKNARQSTLLADLLVATDSEKVTAVLRAGGNPRHAHGPASFGNGPAARGNGAG